MKGYIGRMTPNHTETPILAPTRRLNTKERDVFNRVVAEFAHLTASDEEQLTQYCEAVVRYQIAAKETKKNPLVSTPVVNRSTGNIVGDKLGRNPAWITLKESQTAMNSLARRLMIDASSANKRQSLLTKKARALSGIESQSIADNAVLASITEEQIQAEIQIAAAKYKDATPEVLRQEAIWVLTVLRPILADDPCTDPDIAYLFGC
jgi:P27 family predicted phage terminase small subunit